MAPTSSDDFFSDPPAVLAGMARMLHKAGAPGPSVSLAALALDAARWRSEREGRALPAELAAAAAGLGVPDEPPIELRELQREVLPLLSDKALVGWVPSLVRGFAVETGDPEHLSAEPLLDVTVAALTARARPVEDRALVLYDPACGTGGTLCAASAALIGLGSSVAPAGQDINASAAFIAFSALAAGGLGGTAVAGDCLADDRLPDLRYDFAVADPPYGLGWHSQAERVEALHRSGAFAGGLPPRSDSTLLFVEHLVEKMQPAAEGGGRAVVLLPPTMLLSKGGDAIRRWLLAEDLVEAVIGLPEGLASHTRIRLNALVLTNRRPQQRQGKIQLVDLRGAYEDQGRGRLSRRRIRPDALEALRHALSTVKDGPISRTVQAERFIRRTLKVASRSASDVRRQWLLPLSLADDADAHVAKHVQFPASHVTDAGQDEGCAIDLDDVFNRDAGQVDAWIRERRWPVTRLAAVADEPTFVPSASSSDRVDAVAALPPGPLVMLPIEAGHPTVLGLPTEEPPDRRFIAFRTNEGLDPEFLIGYLNSRHGLIARRAALEPLGGTPSPRTVPRAGVDAMLAALIIPVPDAAAQRRMVDADLAVRAAAARAALAADELWRTPERSADVVRQVAVPERTQSLGEWAQELPYPLATALWAAEARKDNPDAAHRQLFLFWEATAAFTGTVLLSALDEDESLRESEMASLRAALAAGRLSMQRATLGVWLVLVQRLGRRFRDMLDSEDPDERARVAALFAGAPDELVRALCSPELGSLLAAVIKRRNDWAAHGGATTARVLAERNTWLVAQIEALRGIVDDAWGGAPLVRAGRASIGDGVYTYDVELVMGLNTPFLTSTVTVGAQMRTGELYLVTDGAQRALRIEPFVQLRDSPDTEQHTCYFYNRNEGDAARLVSYHLTAEGEVTATSPGLTALLAAFDLQD